VKRLVMCVLALTAISVTAGCGGDDDKSGSGADANKSEQGPIVIGAAINKSGFGEPYDTPPFQALQMAAKKINAKGGLLGRQIKFVTSDAQSDPQRAKAAAQEVIDKGATMVVAPCDYDLGSPAALLAESKGLISFTLCAGSPKWGVQGIGPLSYSPSVSAVAEGFAIAEWAFEKKDWKTAVRVIDPSISFESTVCDAFQRRYEELGGKVLETAEVKAAKGTAISSVVNSVMSNDADVIITCTYPPGGPAVLRQLRANGDNTPAIGPSAMDGAYWLEAVPNLSNFYFETFASVFGDDSSTEVNDFLDEYEAEYGSKPANAYALNGYVLMELYAAAVEKAKSTEGTEVAKALNGFKDQPTLLGPMSYSDEVHIALDRPLAFIEVNKGKHRFLERHELGETPPLFLETP
jgi:branched-chain amino acid transport system substrate-binding protein